jgi:hypothetical protein
VAQLKTAFAQAIRVLKPGARYVVYDAVVTDKFNPADPTHKRIVDTIEYVTGMGVPRCRFAFESVFNSYVAQFLIVGMPKLHQSSELVTAATSAGFTLTCEMDLSRERNWSAYFTDDKLLMFFMKSRLVKGAFKVLESVRLLPRGIGKFNEEFITGTVNALVDSGVRDIVSFSRLLVFQK